MPEREFSVRTVLGDREWKITRHMPDGSVLDVASVQWEVELHHPNLTRERFERALCGLVEVQPERTWSLAPVPGTFMARLLHNGREVGGVVWVPGMSWKPDRQRWMDAIVDGLNQDRGHGDPFPEPKPHHRRRYDLDIPGDFDFATGEEIPESERGVAA